MGRETVAVCHWQGDAAEVNLHLDAAGLQLRGDLRLDVPRADIDEVALIAEGLRVTTKGLDLVIEMTADGARRWQKAILKKPPTLREKMGVSAETPAFVQGDFSDEPLEHALAGATVGGPDAAALLIAVVFDEAGLKAASDLAHAHPAKHIWMIHRKGKGAVIGDTMIRTNMRAKGFIDSKTSAVSDQLTGTRYRLRPK